MKKVIGYVLAIIGLAVLALGSGAFNLDIAILKTLSSSTITIAGIVLIVVGIFIAQKSGRSGSKMSRTKEVPIYEGTGKKRTIVGYQRTS